MGVRATNFTGALTRDSARGTLDVGTANLNGTLAWRRTRSLAGALSWRSAWHLTGDALRVRATNFTGALTRDSARGSLNVGAANLTGTLAWLAWRRTRSLAGALSWRSAWHLARPALGVRAPNLLGGTFAWRSAGYLAGAALGAESTTIGWQWS